MEDSRVGVKRDLSLPLESCSEVSNLSQERVAVKCASEAELICQNVRAHPALSFLSKFVHEKHRVKWFIQNSDHP